MNNPLNKILLFFLLYGWLIPNQYGQVRTCGTMNYMKQQMEEDPGLQERRNIIESYLSNHRRASSRSSNTIITIPVVVHVVHRNATENISKNQILSQLQVLNEDFRRLNADASDTPSAFQGVAADIELEFCLATMDPNGNTTEGITRTSTDQLSFSISDQIKYTSSGGIDVWDATSYLNIWVGNLGPLLGYAQLPGGNPNTDGIVIDYRSFGTSGTATTPYHLGRTATHEVGHWLNLFHIWGDGGCSLDDAVADTPLAGSFSINGGSCSFPAQNTCNEGVGDLPDMFQNFMDYSHDGCMNLFTQGQKVRMRSLFEGNNARASLLQSNGCASPAANLSFISTDKLTFKDPCHCADPQNCISGNNHYFHDVIRIPSSGAIASGLEIKVNNSSYIFSKVPCTGGRLVAPTNSTAFREVATGVYELEFWRPAGSLPSLSVIENNRITTVPPAVFSPICTYESCNSHRVANIPTMSEWGKLIFMLLVLNISLICLFKLEEMVCE